jgi:hypothetical protein
MNIVSRSAEYLQMRYAQYPSLIDASIQEAMRSNKAQIRGRRKFVSKVITASTRELVDDNTKIVYGVSNIKEKTLGEKIFCLEAIKFEYGLVGTAAQDVKALTFHSTVFAPGATSAFIPDLVLNSTFKMTVDNGRTMVIEALVKELVLPAPNGVSRDDFAFALDVPVIFDGMQNIELVIDGLGALVSTAATHGARVTLIGSTIVAGTVI